MAVVPPRKSLSRLRLSPHYSGLAKFQVADGDVLKFHLEALDANAYDEVTQICRHLDLEFEDFSGPASENGVLRRLTIRKGGCDIPEEEDAAARGGGDHDGSAGCAEQERKAQGDEAGPMPAPAVAGTKRKRDLRAVADAERLMAGPKQERLRAFYRALVDSFPGHHMPMAKLLVAHVRGGGVSAPSSSSSSSSDSSSSSSSSSSPAKKKQKKTKKDKNKASK